MAIVNRKLLVIPFIYETRKRDLGLLRVRKIVRINDLQREKRAAWSDIPLY